MSKIYFANKCIHIFLSDQNKISNKCSKRKNRNTKVKKQQKPIVATRTMICNMIKLHV